MNISVLDPGSLRVSPLDYPNGSRNTLPIGEVLNSRALLSSVEYLAENVKH